MLSFFLERAVNEKHEGIPRNQITNPGEFKQGTGDLGGRISFGWDGWSPLAWRNTWDTCWSHNKREQLCRHLFKSSVVHEDGKHFPSLPPHVFMPANMLSWRIVHIRGHLVKTSSKSPKPSNSFQSMAPSKFLSADVTRDWRIILGWMLEGHLGYRNHRPCKSVDMGVRSWVRDSTSWGGSPSRAKPPTISFKPTSWLPGLPTAKSWKTRRIVPCSSSTLTWIASIL